MPATSPCRLIVDPPADGAWNMAVDEALLALATEDHLPTLRLYQWKCPTLSLGYFQRYADRRRHPPSRDANVVRRLSGGGAIVHDQELTYSLVLPETHRLASDTGQLYDIVHRAVVQWLRQRLEAADAPWQPVLCQPVAPVPRHCEPFLCFERRAVGDILLRSAVSPQVEHKIVGSAQRRQRGVVLQHGSMLLGRSSEAPELPGCAELTECPWPAETIASELSQVMLRTLDLEARPTELPSGARASAERIQRHKYSQPSWTERR